MSLQDLNEKLYGRDIHLGRVEQHTTFDPELKAVHADVEEQFRKKEAWATPVPQINPLQVIAAVTKRKRVRMIAFILGGLAVILLIVGATFKIRSMLFNENNVTVSLTGPKDVASVEETTFTVTYANNNWGELDNATLTLSYPETFHLQAESTMKVNGSLAEISIGKIAANTNGKVSLKGKFYGSKGDKLDLQATLKYSPSNVSSVLEKVSKLTVTVATSPLLLEITAPLDIVTGQDIDYVIDYSNKSDVSFSNLRVKLDYPDGFQFVSAEPKPSEGNTVWYVGNFDTNAKGKIVVHGVISGTQQEYKNIHGTIGFFRGDNTFVAYSESNRQTRIVTSPLSISQTVNGLTDIAVNTGDTLQYTIHYKNDGNIGFRDAIITVEIDPTFLDMTKLSVRDGAYDAARKMIIWKASDVRALGKLEVGAEGEVSFSVPVAEKISSVSGKNLLIKTVAKIDSLDIPTTLGSNKIIASNTLFVKLKSFVNIETTVFYTDTVLPNSGPIPPKVGQETTYTVHLSIANSLNDLKDARMSITLPTGVHYTGKYSPSEESFTYNERSNEIVWEIGTIPATENKNREIIFQVSATPGPDQVTKTLTLLNGEIFTATDTFTNQDIRIEKQKQDNTLKNDTAFGSSGNTGTVQPAD